MILVYLKTFLRKLGTIDENKFNTVRYLNRSSRIESQKSIKYLNLSIEIRKLCDLKVKKKKEKIDINIEDRPLLTW